MKSFFIKDTNKQYSIREDGVIIRHYINTKYSTKVFKDNILCIHNQLSSIYINKKKITVSIQYLLFDYFGFRLCNKCNNKIYNKTYKKCNKCKHDKILITEKIHYHNNKESHRLSCQKQRDKLADWYVLSTIRVRRKNIPKEMILAKRQQLLLHRQLKTI